MNKEKLLKQVKDYVKEQGLDKGRVSNRTAWIRFYLFAYMKSTFKGLSLADIGAVCNKDHSSVVYGIQRHNEWIQDDFAYKVAVRETAMLFPIKGQELSDVNSKLLTVELRPEESKRLELYRITNDIRTSSDAIRHLIRKAQIKID